MVVDVAVRSIKAMCPICMSFRGVVKRASSTAYTDSIFEWLLMYYVGYDGWFIGMTIRNLCMKRFCRCSNVLEWYFFFSTRNPEAAHTKNRAREQFTFFKTRSCSLALNTIYKSRCSGPLCVRWNRNHLYVLSTCTHGANFMLFGGLLQCVAFWIARSVFF